MMRHFRAVAVAFIPAAVVLAAAWQAYGQPAAPATQPSMAVAEVELPDGATAMLGPVMGGTGPTRINSVAITADGRLVVTGDEDGAVRLWACPVEAAASGTGTAARGSGAGPTSSGTITASSGTAAGGVQCGPVGKEIRVFALPGGQAGGPISKVLFSGDGRLVAASNAEGVFVWDTSSGKSLTAVKAAGAKLEGFHSGDNEIAAMTDKQVTYWAVDGGGVLREEKPEDLTVPRYMLPAGCTRREGEVVEDSFGEYYGALWWIESKINYQQGLMFTIAEKAGRRMVNQYTVLPKAPKDCRPVAAFSMPGGRLLAVGVDNSLALWDMATGQKVRDVKGHKSRVSAIAFSADGKSMVSADEGGVAYVWAQETIAGRPAGKVDVSATWSQLAADNNAALRLVWQMVDGQDKAVELIERKLCPVSDLDQATYEKLVADLDNDKYPVRKNALDKLAREAPALWPRLKETMAKTASAQVRNALESIIAKVDRPNASQELRSVQVLERIGTADAVKLLAMLAAKDESPEMAKAAKAALAHFQGSTPATQPASSSATAPGK